MDDKEKRIEQINTSISKLLKDFEYASNFDEKRKINDNVLELVLEWENLNGMARPGAQNLVGYYGRSKYGR